METKEAFETLLVKLRAALKTAQEQGSKAFEQGQFSEAPVAAKRGKDLKTQIQNLEALQLRWENLILGSDKLVVEKVSKRKRKHLSRGQKTPQKTFRLPILLALEERDGRGSVEDILERVYELVKPDLNDLDYELLKNGRSVRWRNTTQWERNQLVTEGLLKSDSPRGVWEITEEGLKYLHTKIQPQVIKETIDRSATLKTIPRILPSQIRGKGTPRKTMRLIILRVMSEMGGHGEIGEILKKVEFFGKEIFTPFDYERISNGKEVRWRNSARFERQNMVNDGLLHADSPKGIWEMTEKGHTFLRKNQ